MTVSIANKHTRQPLSLPHQFFFFFRPSICFYLLFLSWWLFVVILHASTRSFGWSSNTEFQSQNIGQRVRRPTISYHCAPNLIQITSTVQSKLHCLCNFNHCMTYGYTWSIFFWELRNKRVISHQENFQQQSLSISLENIHRKHKRQNRARSTSSKQNSKSQQSNRIYSKLCKMCVCISVFTVKNLNATQM